MLSPLKWSHLIVPLVPSSMAPDLIHYFAPFILGIPSDEGNSDLLNSLPSDVTLVDLDVGRVILATSLGGEEASNSRSRPLRSQMLHFAEILGEIFGKQICSDSWCCDSPFSNGGYCAADADQAEMVRCNIFGNAFSSVTEVCFQIMTELLAGANSCCYLIKEVNEESEDKKYIQTSQSRGESSILFDEERFFHIKNMRAQGLYMPLLPDSMLHLSHTRCTGLRSCTDLALIPGDFDLVFETFLRSQGMSTYISAYKESCMVYW